MLLLRPTLSSRLPAKNTARLQAQAGAAAKAHAQFEGDSADKHAAKIEALNAAHGKHADALNEHARNANA